MIIHGHHSVLQRQRQECIILPYGISCDKNWCVFLTIYKWAQNLLKITRLRKKFDQHCRLEFRNDKGYLLRLVFLDKCNFSLSGKEKKQNCRICGSERLNEAYETLCNSSSVIFQRAVSKNDIKVPRFFDNENVTGSTCKKMLRYFFISQTSRLNAEHDIPTWLCTAVVFTRHEVRDW